jgi:hypothetical protein
MPHRTIKIGYERPTTLYSLARLPQPHEHIIDDITRVISHDRVREPEQSGILGSKEPFQHRAVTRAEREDVGILRDGSAIALVPAVQLTQPRPSRLTVLGRREEETKGRDR